MPCDDYFEPEPAPPALPLGEVALPGVALVPEPPVPALPGVVLLPELLPEPLPEPLPVEPALLPCCCMHFSRSVPVMPTHWLGVALVPELLLPDDMPPEEPELPPDDMPPDEPPELPEDMPPELPPAPCDELLPLAPVEPLLPLLPLVCAIAAVATKAEITAALMSFNVI